LDNDELCIAFIEYVKLTRLNNQYIYSTLIKILWNQRK
jgi:hypothetical protein